MEYRPHPTRWRESALLWIPVGLLFVVAIVSQQTEVIAPDVSRAATWAGLALMATVGCYAIFRSNVSRCPTCNRTLTRPRRTCDFVCPHCAITWQCRDRTN